MIGTFTRFAVLLALIGWGLAGAPDLFAQTALSGAALENGCREYVGKAVKYATEWEQL